MISITKQVTKVNHTFGVYQILYLISLLIGAILISCNIYIKSEESAQAQPQNDTVYLNNLYKNSIFGSQIADIAKNKSPNQPLRIFAEKTLIFQQQLKHKVDSASQVNNIPVSDELTDNQKSFIKKLSNEKPDDFDRQFLSLMEEQMTDQMDLLENISTRSEDNEITTWAISMLPIVQVRMDTLFLFKKKINSK